MKTKLTSPRRHFINKIEDVTKRIASLKKYNKDIEDQIVVWNDRIKNDKSDAFVRLQKKQVIESVKKYTHLLKVNKDYIEELRKSK
jgi:hypothetical protein